MFDETLTETVNKHHVTCLCFATLELHIMERQLAMADLRSGNAKITHFVLFTKLNKKLIIYS